MIEKLVKTEAVKYINKFFRNIKNKTPLEIKKIKRLAMSKNISLKEKRKTFCKKCLSPYKNPKTRIKKGVKITTCGNCGYVSRWKL